jgi:hypothetical protein
MEPARRMNIPQGDSKNQAPHQRARESGPVCLVAVLPASDHMIALVDRFQKRREMLGGPRFFRGRHEYKWQARALQAPFHSTAEAVASDRHDRALDGSSRVRDQIRQGRDDGVGVFRGRVGQQDDPDAGVRQRITPEVIGEGIVAGFGCAHSGFPERWLKRRGRKAKWPSADRAGRGCVRAAFACGPNGASRRLH